MMAQPPSLLQRLARSRVPDLLRGQDDVWRGSCPNCSRLFGVESCFEVYPDFFRCRDCGVHGDAVFLLRAADGISEADARATIARMRQQ